MVEIDLIQIQYFYFSINSLQIVFPLTSTYNTYYGMDSDVHKSKSSNQSQQPPTFDFYTVGTINPYEIKSKAIRKAHCDLNNSSIKKPEPSSNQYENQIINEQAQSLIEEAENMKSKNISFEDIENEVTGLKYFEEDKEVVYEYEPSNSSEEELSPQYHEINELISLASDNTEETEFYLVCKIKMDRNEVMKESIVQRKAFAQNLKCEIQRHFEYSPFVVFKIKVCSGVRIFYVKIVVGNDTIQSQSISYCAKKEIQLSKNCHYDFKRKEYLQLSLLEEFIVLSCAKIKNPLCLFEELKKNQKKLLSQKFIVREDTKDLIIQTENRTNFYELILKLAEYSTDKLSLQKILAIPAKEENYDLVDQEIGKKVIEELVNLVLAEENKHWKNLKMDECKKILANLLKGISKHKFSKELHFIISSYTKKKMSLLSKFCVLDTFIEEFVRKTETVVSSLQELEILSVYYYVIVMKDHQNVLQKFLNAFTLQKVHQGHITRVHSYLKQILQIDKSFQKIKPHIMFNFVKAYSCFSQDFKSCFPVQSMKKRIKKILQKQIKHEYTLYLLNFLCIEENFPQLMDQNELKDEIKLFLSNKEFLSSVERMKDFNRLIFLQTMKKNIYETFKKDYIDKLKNKFSYTNALSIVNSGLTDEMLANQQISEEIKNIVNKILSHQDDYELAKNDIDTWHNNFNYHIYISEMLTDRMVEAIDSTEDGYRIKEKHQRIKEQIIRYAKPEDQDSLLSIILMKDIDINAEEIFNIIMSDTPNINFFLTLKNKKNEKARKLVGELEKVSEKLQNIKYRQLKKLFQFNQKEKKSFEKLFGTKLYKYLENQLNELKPSKERILNIQTFVQTMENKYFADKRNCEEKKKQLSKKSDELDEKIISDNRKIQIFPTLPNALLLLYQYEFFFDGCDLTGLNIEKIRQIADDQINTFCEKIQKLFDGLSSNQLQFFQYGYFNFDLIPEEEIEKILKMKQIEKVVAPQKKSELMQIIRLNKKVDFFISLCHSLLFFTEGDHVVEEKFIRNLKNCVQCLSKMKKPYREDSLPVSDLFKNGKLFSEIMSQFNIKWDQNSLFKQYNEYDRKKQIQTSLEDNENSILLILLVTWKNYKTFEKMNGLNENLQVMKEKIRERTDDKISLKHKDFLQFEDIFRFFKRTVEKRKSLKHFLENLHALDKRNDLTVKLIRVTNKYEEFTAFSNYIKQPHFLEAISIYQIVDSSEFIIEINSKQYKGSYTLKTKIFGKEKDIDESKMVKLKDEALLNITKLSSEKKSKDEVQKNQIFLQIVKGYEDIRNVENSLLSYGYIYFSIYKFKIQIKNGNLNEIKEYYQRRKEILEKWKEKIQSIYDFSEKATMLKGCKIKEFFQFLLQKEQKNNKFRYIADIKFINKFKKNFIQEKKFTHERSNDSFQCLELIMNFFKELRKDYDMKGQKAKDREIQIVEIYKFSENDRDYIYSLSQIDKSKLEKLNEANLLSCHGETSYEQIESFMERIRNVDEEFIIMGYENLSLQNQTFMINKIGYHLNEKKLKIKICLVGNSSKQKIFQYFNNQLGAKKIEGCEKLQSKKKKENYTQFIKEKIQKSNGTVKIFKSRYEGLGKTHMIVEELKRCQKQAKFFSISGKITTQRIYERLKRICDGNKAFGLVIQIYDIKPESMKIVNNFLTQIILWRSFCYKSEYCCLNTETPIYLEFQNIIREDHKDLSEELTFVKQLEKQFHITTYINDFSEIKIFPDNVKLYYILEYLILFDEDSLDKKQVPRFEQYKKPQKYSEKSSQLLDKYFVKVIKKKSFHLFNAWVQVFFESCQVFSNSPYLKIQQLKQSYPDQKEREKLKIEKARSDFFKVLYKNTLDFLEQGTENEDYMKESSIFTQKLREFPFFIVPNVDDKSSFSFVYRDYKQIPEIVQFFMISQDPQFQSKELRKKTIEERAQKILGKSSLNVLEQKFQKQFFNELNKIIRNISGNRSYDVLGDPNYTINLDNFFKICLLTYRMNANLPIIVEGEAGVGKTALLRHMSEKIFNYKFLIFNINAGTTEEQLLKNLDKIKEETEKIENGKLCVFFDEFNTLPELGYISELIMERKFQGQKKEFMQNVIPMGACNPFRKIKMKEEKAKTVYHVLPPPLSMVDFKWNFGSLSDIEMGKYIKYMLREIDNDLVGMRTIDVILKIQRCLEDKQFGSVSLRDIERVRQLYRWFKENLPDKPNIPIPPEINDFYLKINLRSFICSVMFTFYLRKNSDKKREEILDMINEIFILEKENFVRFKEFEEDDFCSRLRIEDPNISLNRSLKQNLFCIFVCMNMKIPVILIGDPGCSKSLASRIICNNFKNRNLLKGEWMKKFVTIKDFPFQGSITCKSESIRQLFVRAEDQMKDARQANQISFIVFDQIGLAEKSRHNPLKVIHPFLQMSEYFNENTGKYEQRKYSFLGISNDPLDMSKMSRFLVIWRPKLKKSDLKTTAFDISKGMLHGSSSQLISTIKPSLSNFADSYVNFISEWEKNHGGQKKVKKFFGLRDFYNLVKTYVDLLIQDDVKSCQRKKQEMLTYKSIFRNFSGFQDSFEIFLKQFCSELKIEGIEKFDVLEEIFHSLHKVGKRFPLVIVPDDELSETVFRCVVKKKFKSYLPFTGSPFKNDQQNNPYILKSLTRIIRSTETEQILVASSLNQTIETALFDLFNKFFFNRNGQDYYRVGLESGFTFTEVVNPNFNCAVILRKSDIFNVSSAFLNRFEKYEYDFKEQKIEKMEIIYEGIQKQFFHRIEKICEENELQHYKINHLFANSSQLAVKTLIYKQILQGNRKFEDQLINQCFQQICLHSTRDFEEIFKLLIEPQKLLSEDVLEKIKTQLGKKQTMFDQLPGMVLFTSDPSLWRKEDRAKVINLQFIKTEDQFERQVFLFFCSTTQQTLYIDVKSQLKREAEENSIRDKINIQYLIIKVEEIKAKINIQKEHKKIVKKQCKIIINFDRRKPVEPLSYFLDYPQFFYDGNREITGTHNKEQAFNNISMKPLLKSALKYFTFVYCEELIKEIDDFSLLFQHNVLDEIIENELYVSHCKKAISEFEGSNIRIDDDKILQALKDSDQFQKTRNIQTIITKLYFEDKFKAPIIILTEKLFNTSLFFCYSSYYRAQILEKTFDPQYSKNIFKLFRDRSEESKKVFNDYLTAVVSEKIKFEKNSYMMMKQAKRLTEQKLRKQIQVKKPIFFPNSNHEISLFLLDESNEKNLIFRSKKLCAIKDDDEYKKSWNEFVEFYEKNTKYLINGEKEFFIKINEDKQLKKLISIDIVAAFLEKQRISLKYALNFEDILSSFSVINKDISFLVCVLFGNSQIWSAIFKILQSFLNYSITPDFKLKQQKIRDKENSIKCIMEEYLKHFIATIKSYFKFNESGLCKFKNNISTFMTIFRQCIEQLQLLQNAQKIKKNELTELKLLREFFIFWENLNENYPGEQPPIDSIFKIEEQNIYKKIFKFLLQVEKKRPQAIKLIYDYEASKLFNAWYTEGKYEEFSKTEFLTLCDKNEFFAHYSISVFNKIFQSIFSLNKPLLELAKDYEGLRKRSDKLLIQIGKICEKKSYDNNISVLLCNNFYKNFEYLYRSQIEKDGIEEFLEKRKSEFEVALNNINTQKDPILRILFFAFMKIYLYYYIEILQTGNTPKIIEQIDKRLSSDMDVISNLRFYCLKLLRKKNTTKEIHKNYFQLARADWTNLLKDKMKKEDNAKAIFVPKSDKAHELQELIKQFKNSDGKEVKLLDKIVEYGCNHKYEVLLFFMSYLYSKAYNTGVYQSAIVDHIKNNKDKYLGYFEGKEYELLLRYSESKFDDFLYVKQYQDFNEDQLIIFNCFNLLMSNRIQCSPMHSLFFDQKGESKKSVVDEIQKSYILSGMQNPFISIAKGVSTQTRNNNIGVYLCSTQCDYIYCHLDCGWPNQARPCLMCGEQIGSEGGFLFNGHKLSRSDKGAKRLISKKLIDKSDFYVSRLSKYENFWESQRFYIESEINRMRKKNQVVVKKEDIKLTGYNIDLNNERIGIMTSKVLSLCLKTNIYCFISLGLISDRDARKMLQIKEEESCLRTLFGQINQLIKEIKGVVNLDQNFYGWIFGIQKQIYHCLNNFERQVQEYVKSMEDREALLAKKLKEDYENAAVKKVYYELFKDLQIAVRSGIISKEYKEILQKKEFTARNQFSRIIFEKRIESLIEKHLHEDKLQFANANYVLQGKMQFPFDKFLTESEPEPEFIYSKVLKVPSQRQTFEKIIETYEIIIKEKYPYLDYLIKNISVFSSIKHYQTVISFINEIMMITQHRYSRSQCEKMALSTFVKDHKSLNSKLSQFVNSWKELSKFLKGIQIQCKYYGTINDQLDANGVLKNFILEKDIKNNASGMIVTGILHNFALVHNEVVTVMNARKNKISDYRSIKYVIQSKTVNPQNITYKSQKAQKQVINLDERELQKQIVEKSIDSVKYGDNMIFHHFGSCEHELLNHLKGMSELESSIQKYKSIIYVGEAFGKNSPYSDAIRTVRQKFYEKLEQEKLEEIRDEIDGITNESDRNSFKGSLESIIIQIAEYSSFDIKDQELLKFKEYYGLKFDQDALSRTFLSLKLSHLVPCYEFLEEKMHQFIIQDVHQWYTNNIDPEKEKSIISFFEGLPGQVDDFMPTLRETKEAICRFVYRNMLCESFPKELKMMEFVGAKEDFWPYGDDIYTKGKVFNQNEHIQSLTMEFGAHLCKIVCQLERKSRK